jgi:hypothetical protein
MINGFSKSAILSVPIGGTTEKVNKNYVKIDIVKHFLYL